MSARGGASRGPTSIRRDPACGTCRKKCRKCDRTRPVCKRCESKGLHCEGYPPRFTFWGVGEEASGSPSAAGAASSSSAAASPSPSSSSAAQQQQHQHQQQQQVAFGSDSNASSDTAAHMFFGGPFGDVGSVGASGSSHTTTPVTTTSSGHNAGMGPSSVASPVDHRDSAVSTPASMGFSATGQRQHLQHSASPMAAVGLNMGSTPAAAMAAAAAGRTATPVEEVLSSNEWLLSHFDRDVVDTLAISVEGMENPFRQHVVPLAHRHAGVLHALLGLASCHMCESHLLTGKSIEAVSLQHRVAALHALGALLLREEVVGLNEFEEECVLAIVLLLVLHDIGETGISTNGAHLTGVAFLCDRIARLQDLSHPSKAGVLFLVATLAWLDVLRGFSGAEKLAYSQDVRACVRDNWSFGLYMTIGCPPDIFYCMGTVLEMAKANFLGTRSAAAFRTSLEAAESYLRRWRWETHGNVCPTNDHSWTLLAEAYRHACLLRLMRWPDTFGRPCEDPAIQASVVAILDACAGLPVTSSFYKRMLFPLFLAGAETSSPHRKHYVDICIDRIKEATGCQHHGMTDILHQVWEERRLNTRGWVNVPWMEFLEGRQHAYLFF